MSAIFSDNFNRADGDPGANWTIVTGTITKLQISSNKIDDNGSTPPTGSIMKCNTQASSADYYIQVDLTNNGGTAVNNYIFGRWNGVDPWNSTGVTMYWFVLHSNGNWELTRRVSDADVQIASGTTTDISNSHTFKLSMNGTTIEVYRDGSLLGGGTDSAISSIGYAAICGGNTTTPSITYDNFELGDFLGTTSTSTTVSSSTTTTQSTSTTRSTSTSSTTTSSSTTQSTSTTRSTSTSTTTTLAQGVVSYLFDGSEVSNHIQTFLPDGFEIGTDDKVNANGIVYYYFAFKKQKDFFEIGSYTGDGNNNRHIGTIFQEELTWIQKTSGSISTWQEPVYTTLTASPFAHTLRFPNSSTLTTAILLIQDPGFQLGTHATVNASGESYAYFIWKNPSRSDFSYKYYEYRVFDNNVYQTSWTKEVLSQPKFRNIINGGPGEVIVKLARSFDDFGENDDVKLNNRVDIWVYDRQYPNGQRLYRGFISGYRPVLNGNEEYVEITLLSYITQLSYFMLRDGSGSTTIAYNSYDPSDILKNIIDKYRADGGVINYTTSSIQDTNTTVSYTFKSNTVKEAIDKVIELAPQGWYWTVDANSIIYLKPKSVTAIHTFIIGTHIAQMETWRRIEDVINRVYFTGFTTVSGTGMYRVYSNSGSIDSYGLHAIQKVDHRVSVTATADTMSNRILNSKSEPEIRTLMVISDDNGENKYQGYDIESIIPGDTLKIRNIKMGTKTSTRWDQFTWDVDVWDATLSSTAADVIQILSLDYEPNQLRIEASSRLPEISKRIEDINRNLIQDETKDNPSSPTAG